MELILQHQLEQIAVGGDFGVEDCLDVRGFWRLGGELAAGGADFRAVGYLAHADDLVMPCCRVVEPVIEPGIVLVLLNVLSGRSVKGLCEAVEAAEFQVAGAQTKRE